MTKKEKAVIKKMFKRWGRNIKERLSTFISWAYPIVNILMIISAVIGACGLDSEGTNIPLLMVLVPELYFIIIMFITHGREIIEGIKAEWQGRRYVEYDDDEDDVE